ncbi:unnamed protein product [Alopecurus aequalis]
MATSSKTVTLRSSDGEELLVKVDTIAAASALIRDMLEDDSAAGVISLPRVTGSILGRIVDYCNCHYAAACKVGPDLERFDADFLRGIDSDTLMGLILAANYLDMQGLLDLACKTAADQTRGRTVDKTSSSLAPPKVPMELHRGNRERLVTALRAHLSASARPLLGLALLQGGEEQTRHCTDHVELFRQESYFAYLFGVREPGFYGAVDIASGKSILFAPRLPSDYAVWMGEIKSPSYFKDMYKVDEGSSMLMSLHRKQTIVYNAVLKAHNVVISHMRPGVKWIDMHKLAEQKILESLEKESIIQGDIGDMMDRRIGAVFMPHGLGHLLGIDTHDVGGYPEGSERPNEPGLNALRTIRELKEGMAITVEPGCYFIDALLRHVREDPISSKFFNWEQIEKYKRFGGIRIESNLYVTAKGCKNMTNCPRETWEIEAVMAGARWPSHAKN